VTGPTRVVGPHDGRTYLWEWTLGTGETGTPVVVPHKAEKTVHVYGTFGGTVTLEGTLEGPAETPAHFVGLTNSKGDAISATADYLATIQENVYLIRPVAGSGVTAVTVRVLMVG
jgi:hypothetical protein